MNLNPTIHKIIAELSHGPSTAKELSSLLNVPIGNVILILKTNNRFSRNEDGTWELNR